MRKPHRGPPASAWAGLAALQAPATPKPATDRRAATKRRKTRRILTKLAGSWRPVAVNVSKSGFFVWRPDSKAGIATIAHESWKDLEANTPAEAIAIMRALVAELELQAAFAQLGAPLVFADMAASGKAAAAGRKSGATTSQQAADRREDIFKMARSILASDPGLSNSRLAEQIVGRRDLGESKQTTERLLARLLGKKGARRRKA